MRHLILALIFLILVIVSILLFKYFQKRKPQLELFSPSLANGEASIGKFKINSVTPGTKPDTLELHYTTYKNTAVFQGDIIIGIVQKSHGKYMRMQGFFTTQAIWEDSIIPFDFDGAVLSSDTSVVYDAMREWTTKTKVRFIPHTDETNFVRFSYGDGYGSFIGQTGNMQPLYFPKDPDKGNIMHEIGHLLGLWHEHCRPDRDRYIKITNSNIREAFLCQFIQPISDVVTLNTPYDFNSIMHYPKDAFAKPGTKTITIINDSPRYHLGNRNILSSGDVAGIKLLYQKSSAMASHKGLKQTQITCSEN